MIFIAHRGNVNGREPKLENKPTYIESAIKQGYCSEIDLWYKNKNFWLGHDEPKYKITHHWLINNSYALWVHCKNYEALTYLSRRDNKYLRNQSINYFWHDKDDYTLTSNGFIWCHSGTHVLPNSICVIPEIKFSGDIKKCYGVCSDQIKYWKTVW